MAIPAGDQDPFSPEANQNKEILEVMQLAQKLEDLAQAFDPEYALDLEDEANSHTWVQDGFVESIGSTDIGGVLTTDLIFEVQRQREATESRLGFPFYDSPYESKYTIIDSIKLEGLKLASFPTAMQEYIAKMGDYKPKYLQKRKREFAIRYREEYTITSSGSFRFLPSFTISVDGDEIDIPNTDMPPAAAYYEDSDDESDDPGEQEHGLQDWGELSDIFSPEEMLSLSAVSKQVVESHFKTSALEQFYQNIDAIRFLPTKDHLPRALNIAEQVLNRKKFAGATDGN